MPNEKRMEVKSEKPRVRFSKSGAPYTLVEDIFRSGKGQEIISRMATLRRNALTAHLKPLPADRDEE
jgi:hypothetical protein